MPRTTLKLATAAALTLAVTACSGAEADDAGDPIATVVDADEAVQMLTDRDDLQIIDVRTPAEFEAGHLTDAQLIDVQDRSFTEQVEQLDPEAAYLVYCRTGNRSAHAISLMRDLGFSELYDAGGLAELAAAGASVADAG